MIRQTCVALCLMSGPVSADSLCGVAGDVALAQLGGFWNVDGATSVELMNESVVGSYDGLALLKTSGGFTASGIGRFNGDEVTLVARQVYDVDGVDDLLETVEAEWIADRVSETPCGPEALPQFSARFGDEETAWAGRVTLVPYFTDQIVLLAEIEMTGAWGIAFTTYAALLTPDR